MGYTLLNINPFTRKDSIFSDMMPLKEPSSVTSVTDNTSGGGSISVIIMSLAGVYIIYTVLNYLLKKRGIQLLPFVDNYIEARPQRVYFGRLVAKSEIVTALIGFISVLNNPKIKETVADFTLLYSLEGKAHFFLELLKKENGVEKIELADNLDTMLSHDKNLIIELIKYVENTMVLRVSTVDKTLTTILSGLEEAINRYKGSMSEALEYEIELNSELKAREINYANYDSDLLDRRGYTVPEPVRYSDDPFIDAMVRKTVEKEEGNSSMVHDNRLVKHNEVHSSSEYKFSKSSTSTESSHSDSGSISGTSSDSSFD